MRTIELGRARHIGRDDVNFLSAKATEIVIKRHRRTAFGGQKKLRKNQITTGRHAYIL